MTLVSTKKLPPYELRHLKGVFTLTSIVNFIFCDLGTNGFSSPSRAILAVSSLKSLCVCVCVCVCVCGHCLGGDLYAHIRLFSAVQSSLVIGLQLNAA